MYEQITHCSEEIETHNGKIKASLLVVEPMSDITALRLPGRAGFLG